jgi:UDP-N-acetylmuramate dehydrogenase
MLKIEYDFNLKNHNTFHVDFLCKKFIEINQREDIDDLIPFLPTDKNMLYVLGEGANTLFTGRFNGTILHSNLKGIHVKKQENDRVHIQVNSGEIWNDFVLSCVQNQYYGVENLILIPGSVGAAPVQNIGAYGVEVGDFIESVEYLDLADFSIRKIGNIDCQFKYRDSIFKGSLSGKILILNVTFVLSTKPSFNASYKPVQAALDNENNLIPSIQDMSRIISSIRRSKLPDPSLLGNAGSFFKNPIISNSHFLKLHERFPEIIAFDSDGKMMKISAAWLIDQCNLKGFSIGGAKVYEKQPLVIVNYGSATCNDITDLSQYIQKKVFEKFGVLLESEVIFL